MKLIILAWWSWTRLWPYSRENYPKQFFNFENWMSLLQHTFSRLKSINNFNDIYVCCTDKYKFNVLNHLKDISNENIIIEPERKNTAPAIAHIIKHLIEKNISLEENIVILPSDHVIRPEQKFIDYLKLWDSYSKKWDIILYWIVPNFPNTWYWYIKYKNTKTQIKNIDKFVEKPDFETAKKYVLSWDYLWNSWIFMFSIKTMIEEMKKHSQKLYSYIYSESSIFKDEYSKLNSISFDYEIIEKTDKIKVIPLEWIFWSDVGSWDSIYDYSKKDEKNNVFDWTIIEEWVENSYIKSQKDKLVIADNVKDLIVIDMKDSLYITKKWNSQNIKNIIDKYKESISQFKDHLISHRPRWDNEVIQNWIWYKIKRLKVFPWKALSKQLHYYRSEHWVVVKWIAKVIRSIYPENQVDSEEFLIWENESLFIPRSYIHKLINPWSQDLEIIEIQVWEYLDEDDIVRLD